MVPRVPESFFFCLDIFEVHFAAEYVFLMEKPKVRKFILSNWAI